MNELLFSCKNEKISLENLLAYNQIKKCDEGINKYNREIEDLRNEINSILASVNVDCDYLNLIVKYKEQLKSMDSDSIRMKELKEKLKINEDKINDFNLNIKDVESELEDLKRLVFDSDDAKVILNTQNEIENLTKKLSNLYDSVEKISNENTTITIELEFIKNANADEGLSNDLVKVEIANELHKTSMNFEEVIKDLELSVRENIEFCIQKINNREKEISKYEDRKNNIVAEFPDALNLDCHKELIGLSSLFEELKLLDDFIEESHIAEESVIDDSSADDDFVQVKEDNIFDQVVEDENVEDTEDEEPLEDNDTDMNIENDMVKVERIEKPDLEFKEVNEAASLMNEDDNEEISVDNSNSFSTIGSVPYIFSEGESLESIAEKVYPSKDCWEAIYNYNKEEIDSYLTANGMSNDPDTIKTLASDKYLFAGIQLNIPTDCNYRG